MRWTAPPAAIRVNQSRVGLSRGSFHLDAPSLLQTELPDSAVYEAARSRVGSVDQRYPPKIIRPIINAQAKNGMKCAILENITDVDSEFLVCFKELVVDVRHIRLPANV